MNKLVIGILLMVGSATDSFADHFRLAVDSVEQAYKASCDRILHYPPHLKSSNTMSIYQCIKDDSIETEPFGELLLRVDVTKDGNLESSTLRECLRITYTDTLFMKKARCHRR